MNKTQLSVPLPLEGELFAGNHGEESIEKMTGFCSSTLQEPVSKTRLIWIAGCIISFCLLIIFGLSGSPITLTALIYMAKRADLFYKEEEGGIK